MVFVWSQLVHGHAAYTLLQVAINDLLVLILYVSTEAAKRAHAAAISVCCAVVSLWVSAGLHPPSSVPLRSLVRCNALTDDAVALRRCFLRRLVRARVSVPAAVCQVPTLYLLLDLSDVHIPYVTIVVSVRERVAPRPRPSRRLRVRLHAARSCSLVAGRDFRAGAVRAGLADALVAASRARAGRRRAAHLARRGLFRAHHHGW